jgi:hypothetical protein
MTAKHVMKKLVRRLHRNLFLSVPNSGPQEIDLSRLRPVQNLTLERPVFNLQFAEQAQRLASRFVLEPWDNKDQDR